MHRMCRAVGIAFPVLMSVACASPAERTPSFTARDSAGVRVVTNARPLWRDGEGWTIDSVPTLAFGADEGDTVAMLQRVAGAMLRSDGTYAVADGGSSQVKYFDAGGRLLRAVGRSGQGPGEYEYIAWLLACGGDSAYVSDIGNNQVSVLDASGRLVRRFRLMTSEVAATPFSTACARSGHIVTSGWGTPPREVTPSRPYRPQVAVDLSRANGRVRHALGSFPGTEMTPVMGGAGPTLGGRWLRIGIGNRQAWLAPNDGRGLIAVDTAGVVRLVVRLASDDKAMTAADVTFLIRQTLDSSGNVQRRAQRERELATQEFPSRLPAHFNLLVDELDHVWVQEHPRAEAPNPPWHIVRSDGVWLGARSMPSGARPLEIGGDYVLALRSSSNGGDEVVRFGLRR